VLHTPISPNGYSIKCRASLGSHVVHHSLTHSLTLLWCLVTYDLTDHPCCPDLPQVRVWSWSPLRLVAMHLCHHTPLALAMDPWGAELIVTYVDSVKVYRWGE
jgi:hypothetical protein